MEAGPFDRHRESRSRPTMHGWQRWLLGDWNPIVRDPTDILRLAFLVGAIAQLPRDNWSGALRLALTFLVCLIPRLLSTPQPFDFSFNVAMSLQAWGNITNLFDTWLPYHDLVHAVLTMATAALFYFVLVRLRLVPDLAERQSRRDWFAMAVLVFAIGSLVGAIYEEYEYFAINYLHAHLVENYGHDIADLEYNAIGALAAAGLLVLWSRYGWGTRRPEKGDPLPRLMHGLERRMERSATEEARRTSRAGRRRERLAHLDRGERPPPSPRLPRLVAGDWSPLVRDVNDLFRLSFFAGIWVALATRQWDIAVRFAITFLATLGTRWMDPPRPFDLAFNLAMAFQAWGDYAGAFGVFGAYQDWTYFLVSLASAIMLYLALLRLKLFPEFADEPGVHRRIAIFLAATSLGYSVGVYYALYIYFANKVLGADFTTGWGLLTLHLGIDWLGSMVGALVLVAWDVYGWGNRRRLRPGLVKLAARGPEPGGAREAERAKAAEEAGRPG